MRPVSVTSPGLRSPSEVILAEPRLMLGTLAFFAGEINSSSLLAERSYSMSTRLAVDALTYGIFLTGDFSYHFQNLVYQERISKSSASQAENLGHES